MAAFLHHCPFLRSVPKPALRRTGAALLSMADQCPIIARQISVSGTACLEAQLNSSPAKTQSPHRPTVDQKRLFAQTATQVAVSSSKGCPFVTSQIGMIQASPEVQEDVHDGTIMKSPAPNYIFNHKGTSISNSFHSQSNFLPFHRFDDNSLEKLQRFCVSNIRASQRRHPPPQGQHG